MVASSPARRSAVANPAPVPLAWNTRSQSLGAASGLDPADRGIAIFHRERKGPGHQGPAHAIVFARRHPTGMDEPFGASTEGAEQGTNLHLAGLRRGNGLLAQLGATGSHIPERFALHVRSCCPVSCGRCPRALVFHYTIKTSTRRAFAALDLAAGRYILKRPQRPAKPFHARTSSPRRGHHRRAHRPVRVAP